MPDPKVGLYLRLSHEDEDGAKESQSITNQRTFLMQYLEKLGWTAAETYIDDGFTGTNFDRPAFQRMIWDIEERRIDTVITKDLSRLGRDYIEVGSYLQRYFPKMGVRYIAVSDGYDSQSSSGMNMAMPFLSVVNDMYAQDISRKVRNTLTARKQQGKFTGASAPFGYTKDPAERGHLLVDDQAAGIVEEIFRDFLLNGSVLGVAKRLTEQGVPTPSAYKGDVNTQSRFPGVWSDSMVRRILTNPTYIGTLTQNRTRKINYKVDKRENLPPDQWIMVEHTHTPVIDRTVFEKAQELLSVRSYSSRAGGGGHLLTGLAFCAECGSPMTYVRESETRTYMVCRGYRSMGRLRLCTAHCVREDLVLRAIRLKLRQMVQLLDLEALANAIRPDDGDGQRRRQIASIQRKIERCKQVSARLYQDRAAALLREQEFLELFEQNRAERTQLERQLEEYAQRDRLEEPAARYTEKIRQVLAFDTLERGILASLIERVFIHEDKTIQLEFCFSEPK